MALDTDIKALAVRVIDVPCTWEDAMKRDVVECEDDGQPAVIDRFHAVMGGNDLSYIRDWLQETNYPYELFQRVLIDPTAGTRTKVDTIVRFTREEHVREYKLTF